MTQSKDTLPYRWKTLRVFISSTFRDMHAERDYLVKYVFPELREWCQQYKLHLIDIDLRWGVTGAEAESGRVLDICLDQIDGSRPFFICMLGNRYGWVPKKEEITEETRKAYDKLQGKEDYSITHLEIRHAVLEPLRSLDALEEIPHAFFYFRDKNSLPSPDELSNYSKLEKKEYYKTYFEEGPKNTTRLDTLKEEIRNHYQKLGETKGNSKEAEERVFSYKPRFEPNLPNPEDDKLKGRFTPESFKEFGERVKADLQKAIASQFHERIKALSERQEQKNLETERDLHESFVENRTRLFIGRTELLKKLHEYVNSDSRKLLAVYGESGSGKSALLAKFYRDFKYDINGNEINKDVLFIPHFAGASPGSCFLPNILRRFCEELKVAYDTKNEWVTPMESNKLSETFKSFVNKTSNNIIILIDGLNQLDESEHAHELNWLPFDLPANLKIIASTLEGKSKDALIIKTDESLVVTPLTNEECREIINKMPSVFCKTLDEKYIQLLLTKEETRNPLYLKVAIDELRVFGSFEKLETKITALPSDIESLFVSVLERLEKDCADESGIVERLFCLVECSRFGLAPQELRELMESVDKHNTYQAILRQMRDYLIPRGELIDFFHRGLSKAIRQKYLFNDKAVQWHRVLAKYFEDQSLHLEVSQLREGEKQQPNVRKLLEQPWQETNGELWKELEETLTSLEFIETKCKAELRYELVDDFRFAIENWPGNEEKKNEEERLIILTNYLEELIAYSEDPKSISFPEPPVILFPKYENNNQQNSDNWTPLIRIQGWEKFVSNNIIRIGSTESIIQLAHNYSKSGPIEKKVNDIIAKRTNNAPWIKLLNRPQINPRAACIRIIQANSNGPIAISADGLRAVSVSAEGDRKIKIWNLNTGERERTFFTNTISVLSSNGFIVVSGIRLNEGRQANNNEKEQALEIWNLKTFERIKIINALRDSSFDKCTISQDGKLVAVIHAGNLNVWNIDTGECIFATEKNSIFYNVIISPNRKYIVTNGSSYSGSSIYIWDLENFKLQNCLSFGLFTEISIAITKDSKKLIVSCHDSTQNRIRIYNLDDDKQFSQIENTNHGALSITPDNKYALISSEKLYLWNLEKGVCVKTFHEPDVTQMRRAEITLDGKFAVIGERSGVIRIWDLMADSTSTFDSHICDVDTVKIIPKRNLVITDAVHYPEQWGDRLGFDPEIRIWDLKNHHCINKFNTSKSDVRGVFVNPNQDQFVLCQSNIFSRLDFQFNLIDNYEHKKYINTSKKYNLKITPDGSRAIYEHSDEKGGILFCWDFLNNQNPTVTIGNYQNRISNFLITHDGSRAITMHYDKTIFSWDLEHSKCLGQLSFDNLNESYLNEENGCSISPDNRFLVAQLYLPKKIGNTETTTILWDLQRFEIIKRLGNSFSRTDQLDFMPDGRMYFSSGVTMGYYADLNNIRTGKSSYLKNYEMGILAVLDSKHIVSYGNENLKIYNVIDNSLIAQINNLGNGYKCYDIIMPLIVVGRRSGNISFLSIENFPLEPAVVTPVRLWLFSPIGQPGHWDKNVTTLCPWCKQRFPTQSKILDTIDRITRNAKLTPDQSPCLHLPDEAWEEPKLISECPLCKKALKYNPFKVDNSEG